MVTGVFAQVSPEDKGSKRVLFGTFTGVFLPTLLTIFGVIMYVRIGWAVGNAGLAGTWLVMLLAMGITTATGLSLSSIATNTRVGPGGPYAILSRSLGFEVGGSIGVPLYLTRPLGVAMYIIGFREGWLWIFPDHNALLVDTIVFVGLAGISYLSANLAFRVQYLIMVVVVLSLVMIFAAPGVYDGPHEIRWWGDYDGFPENGFRGTDFWGVFAVFFPATTGILAGANMSGDLKDPRKAIPAGTLWAIGLSTIVYLALAWWAAQAGSEEELLTNYNLAIDKSLFPPLVLAGLLGATASSALAGLVGGPRILMAMGQNKIIPFADTMAKASDDGNPRAAIAVTSLLTYAILMVRDLNTIAPLVTMFFLITYAMLNVVVLVEGSLGLVSFRPTLRINLLIPLFGLVGCVLSMFIVNPTFGFVSIGLVFAFYVWIQRRGQHGEGEDVRSSVFVSVAQWAASRVTEKDFENKRAWKPNVLFPVTDPEQVRGAFDLLLDLTAPDGSVTLLGVAERENAAVMRKRLVPLAEDLRAKGVQSSSSVLVSKAVSEAVPTGLEVLQAAFFRPNLLVLQVGEGDQEVEIAHAVGRGELRVGVQLITPHPTVGLGQRKSVNVWVRPAPRTWDPIAAFGPGNMNLILLTAYRMMREWGAEVRLITVVPDAEQIPRARRFQAELCDLTRLPNHVLHRVFVGKFEDWLERAPVADLNVLGLLPEFDAPYLRGIVAKTKSTCIFVKDSGRESALV